MSDIDFDIFLEKKKKEGRLYNKRSDGYSLTCTGCSYNMLRSNYCKKFCKDLKRVYQYNGGFQNEPNEECKNYKIKNVDIKYFIECREKKKERINAARKLANLRRIKK